jgi:carboxypeptidase PM20D1
VIAKLKIFLLVFGLIWVVDCGAQSNVQSIDSAYSVQFLSKLTTFENYSGKEKPIFDHLSEWVKSQGLYYEDLSSKDSLYNFIALLSPPSDKPLILFTAHLDVVYADTTGWKYPPFSGTIAENSIWGRGALDDKGPLAMQLLALAKFYQHNLQTELPFNIGILAVSMEETIGTGADFIVENHLKRLNPVVLFGEGGSGMKNIIPSKPNLPVFGISVAEKVPLWLMIEAKVRSKGHSATSDLYASKNLLRALIRIEDQPAKIRFHKVTRKMLKDLGELEGGFKGFVLKHSTSYLFWPFTKKLFREGGIFSSLVSDTYTITQINAITTVPNAIPQDAYAIIDCRLLPGTSIKLFLFKLRLRMGNKVVVTPIFIGKDAKPSEPNDYFKLMADAINSIYPCSEVKPYLFPASSDNNTFRAAGVTTYGITPIMIDNELMETVHNTNERIPIQSYLLGIETYLQFIQNLKFYNFNKPIKK